MLEASGSPARKYSYYMHLALGRVMQNGYRVDEADIATMRQSLAEAAQGDEEKDVGYATFFLGRVLWLHGDLAAAREQMERALAMAERIGESILLGQSLLGLALIALRRHDTETVRALMTQVMAVAEAMASFEYMAGAKACLAWLAWQDGRPDDVIRLSDEIQALMATTVGSGFYQGLIYLWPLIAVHLDAGHVARRWPPAASSCRPRGPGSPVTSSRWWRRPPGPGTRTSPSCAGTAAAAVALARELNYC